MKTIYSKETWARLALVTGSILFTCLALEGGLRVKYWLQPSHLSWDDKRGWRVTENYRAALQAIDAAGRTYASYLTTNEHGFRAFGDVNSAKQKILVIGDSFTYAKDVADEQAYFALLKEMLDVEIFAYGCEGYGTLQEYMVFDAFVEEIQPDILLWQFCWNDFINNSYDLERQSALNNNGWRRPYLTKSGDIEYRTPKPFGSIRSAAIRHSRLLHSIESRLERFSRDERAEGVEEEIRVLGRSHPLLLPAAEVTQTILERVTARGISGRAYSFSVATFEPLDEEMRAVMNRAGFSYIPGVAEAVEAAESAGESVKAADGAHWNAKGHRIAAQVLAKELEPYMAAAQEKRPLSERPVVE